jgi:hypothetical protein
LSASGIPSARRTAGLQSSLESKSQRSSVLSVLRGSTISAPITGWLAVGSQRIVDIASVETDH